MLTFAVYVLIFITTNAFEIPIRQVEVERSNAIGSDFPIDLDPTSKVYLGTISLGGPGQDFNVAFDFSTPALWVPDSGCACGDKCNDEKLCLQFCASHCCGKRVAEEKDGVCSHKNVFDASKSRSYIDDKGTTQISFWNTSVTAIKGFETLRLGPHYRPGFTASQIMFGRVKELPQLYKDLAYDGVFGLGLGSVGELTSPIKQLAVRGAISSQSLTLYLPSPKENIDVGGVLTIGQLDRKRCNSDYEFFDIERNTNEWAFNASGWRFADSAGVVNGSWKGVIDLNSDYLYVPRDVFNHYVNHFSGKVQPDGKVIVQCASNSNIYVTLGGVVHRFLAQDLYAPHMFSNCEVKIRPVAHNAQYDFRFGITAFRRACFLVDYNGRLALPTKK